MKSILTIMFLNASISFASQCPELTGKYNCPSVGQYPPFVASIEQQSVQNITTYSYKYDFISGEHVEAQFTASEQGELNIVNGGKIIFRCEHDNMLSCSSSDANKCSAKTYINKDGSYQADIIEPASTYIVCPKLEKNI